MSQYLLLNRLQVQNANCISGFTWGFPAITHFLGFMHNIQRKLGKSTGLAFEGCAVVCHEFHTHTHQPLPGRDIEFVQSKNPPYIKKHKKDETPPIIEEGRMNMTVSLVIKLENMWMGTNEDKVALEQRIYKLCQFGRLAGGTVLHIDKVGLLGARSDEEEATLLKQLKRRLVPGYVLMDRSHYLEAHYQNLKKQQPNAELLDAWLDFSALKYQAVLKVEDSQNSPTEKDDANWVMCEKPVPTGWLVPMMVGYRAISPVYEAGEVKHARDETIPACFVESVHSIGEWLSCHRIRDIDSMIWRYATKDAWYLCQQQSKSSESDLDELSSENLAFEELFAI